ncbi:hypothetical protein GCM10011372_24350 [Agromyces bauzanensis]|uniref:Uncharacterized protein n=1 Tax=Agromyces bauzanensis TaxID=1308924 RepID=A0A917PND0_9MICO|nr:hypothetical protein GCM10011372_24350 [Agromyces bauzanensis]
MVFAHGNGHVHSEGDLAETVLPVAALLLLVVVSVSSSGVYVQAVGSAR